MNDGPVRVRLDLAYDGTDFLGWAQQPGRRTVQGVLQDALGVLVRSEPPRVQVAGRTDAGVHARGQVAHVDLPVERADDPLLLRRLNGLLPADVRVRRHDVLAWSRPLDVEAMRAACAPMLGEHDFAAFCRRREGATTVRALLALDWARGEDELLVLTIRADAFCHSMVRSVVGAMLAVGEGRRAPSWPAGLLGRTVRADDVAVAAPRGLVLEHVAYPPDDLLQARQSVTRNLRGPATGWTQP